MMYYYVSDNGVATDTPHNNWQYELNNLGFPKGDINHPIENLSIVNGGSTGTLSQYLLDFDVSIGNNPLFGFNWQQLLLSLLTKTDNVDMSFLVKRNYGNGQMVSSASATYKKTWSWLSGAAPISLFESGYNPVHLSFAGTPAYDNIRSSYLLDDNYSFDCIDNADYISFILYAPVLFVPEASALATTNYQINYYQYPPAPLLDTPFSSYILNSAKKRHEHIETSYWSWIDNQTSITLSGPKGVVQTGDVFTISNIPSGYQTPTWSASNNCVTVNNGGITVNSEGAVTITCATNNGYGAYHHKHRKVLAGFPAMELSTSFQGSNVYRITANCSYGGSSLEAVMDELSSNDEISYIWGTESSTGSIVWTDTTSVRYFDLTAPFGEQTFVYMKMHCNPNRESGAVTTSVDRRNIQPFMYDPQEITVTYNHYMIYYRYVSGHPVSTNKYFAVWHNPEYSPTISNPDNILIGSQSYSLQTTLNKTINGVSTQVYCFKFFNSDYVQDAIDTIQTNFNNPEPTGVFIPIKIRCGTTVLQTIYYPIVRITL